MVEIGIGFSQISTYVRPMRKYLFLFILVVTFIGGYGVDNSSAASPESSSTTSTFRALADHAVVELKGTGELDIVVVTDPLCWHCRLGHKLLSDVPEKYRSMKLVFFPRRNFIGSDMAAWILEDAADTDDLKAKVDFAYKHLKQPKTDSLEEARTVVLSQFIVFFPEMLNGPTLEELAERLEREHNPHVLKGAKLAEAADLPGTPILIAGQNVVMGYGPGKWMETLDKNEMCQ